MVMGDDLSWPDTPSHARHTGTPPPTQNDKDKRGLITQSENFFGVLSDWSVPRQTNASELFPISPSLLSLFTYIISIVKVLCNVLRLSDRSNL